MKVAPVAYRARPGQVKSTTESHAASHSGSECPEWHRSRKGVHAGVTQCLCKQGAYQSYHCKAHQLSAKRRIAEQLSCPTKPKAGCELPTRLGAAQKHELPHRLCIGETNTMVCNCVHLCLLFNVQVVHVIRTYNAIWLCYSELHCRIT